jgi:hypothetical protein
MDTQDERGADEMDGDQEGVELGADALVGGGAKILREVNQLKDGGSDAQRPSKANSQVKIDRPKNLLLKSEGTPTPSSSNPLRAWIQVLCLCLDSNLCAQSSL